MILRLVKTECADDMVTPLDSHNIVCHFFCSPERIVDTRSIIDRVDPRAHRAMPGCQLVKLFPESVVFHVISGELNPQSQPQEDQLMTLCPPRAELPSQKALSPSIVFPLTQ